MNTIDPRVYRVRFAGQFVIGDRFTDQYKQVMRSADQEARRFKHEYIGTEHVLLALLKEGSGVGTVLRRLNLSCSTVRLQIEEIAIKGTALVRMVNLPQTPRARNVIEYSREEARNLNHSYVGAEHVLLCLLREQEGFAAAVLTNFGLTLENARKEVIQLWANENREIST